MTRSLVALLVACVIANPVAANPLDAGAPDRVALSLTGDAIVLGGAVAILGATTVLHLAPAQCHWCAAPPAIDATLHDALLGELFSRQAADTASNVWVGAIAPGAALGAAFLATGPDASSGAGLRAAVIVIESTAVSAAAVQSIKYFVARNRPFIQYGHAAGSAGAYDSADADSHLSFPSGHTAAAASFGVSAAMVASLEDSRAAPYLWGAAGVLTAGAGALRMIAEKHYFTDVLAGAALGTACGVAVPLLHRRGSLLGDAASPGAGGTLSLSVAGRAGAQLFAVSGTF